MKSSQYKILVLTDLKETTKRVLKFAINVSQEIDAEIDFFHVKKPVEVVATESQLSAMHAIKKEYIATEKRMQQFIDAVLGSDDIEITANVAFGNIKNEVVKHINAYQPDVIILRDRKPNLLSFTGDKLIDAVLKLKQGLVLFASEADHFDYNSLWTLNSITSKKELARA